MLPPGTPINSRPEEKRVGTQCGPFLAFLNEKDKCRKSNSQHLDRDAYLAWRREHGKVWDGMSAVERAPYSNTGRPDVVDAGDSRMTVDANLRSKRVESVVT
jgi:hypothetical protein